MEHFIYKTTCLITGKFYLGMHSGEVNDGYLGSGIHLKASVKKHGKENHTREILKFCESREALSGAEAAILTNEMRADPMCMNISRGGLGGFAGHKSDTKEKMRAIAAARPASHYVSGEKHGMFGKTHTPEVKARIAAGCKARTGHKYSEEVRRKVSAGLKVYHEKRRQESQ